jgi:putative transposase
MSDGRLFSGQWRWIVSFLDISPESAFIESFNGRLRDECLNVHQFASLADAQAIIDAWRVDYDTRHPHSSLGHLTPSEFVTQRQKPEVLL